MPTACTEISLSLMSFICMNILFVLTVCFIICKFAQKSINVAGKELFMKDHTLDDSDVKFLEEGTNDILSQIPVLFIVSQKFNLMPVSGPNAPRNIVDCGAI